jgi:hypothetical protein
MNPLNQHLQQFQYDALERQKKAQAAELVKEAQKEQERPPRRRR